MLVDLHLYPEHATHVKIYVRIRVNKVEHCAACRCVDV